MSRINKYETGLLRYVAEHYTYSMRDLEHTFIAGGRSYDRLMDVIELAAEIHASLDHAVTVYQPFVLHEMAC